MTRRNALQDALTGHERDGRDRVSDAAYRASGHLVCGVKGQERPAEPTSAHKLVAADPPVAATERAPTGIGLEPVGRRAPMRNPLFGRACAAGERDQIFARDRWRCVVCGDAATTIAATGATPRLVSLCLTCHPPAQPGVLDGIRPAPDPIRHGSGAP